jgi:formylglycine-generating enzyme required for sulfatase activity
VDADPNNCGGCGITCTGSQFTGVCTSGFCELRAGTSWEYCESTPGRGDRPVNLADDDNNCGACGVQCGALSECGARTCSPVPLEFVRISAGTFQMGSPLGELGRSSYAETIHPVTLTRDFLLSRTEVTQGHWQDLLNTNPSFAENPNVPMRNLTWWEAVEFANVLSLAQGLPPCYTLSGCSGALGSGSFNCEDVTVNAAGSNPLLCTGYRLPTEAEWEYSYRAGTSTAFYSGEITYDRSEPVDENLDAIGWYRGNSTSLNSGRVGLKAPNAWGLFDMAGNTSEWCWDWFNTYPGTVVDPLGLESGGTWRVYRGGGLYNDAAFARAAYRYDGTASSNGCCDIGIRLARTAP